MPVVDRDGVRISYDVRGSGAPLLLVMGTGSPGRVWHLHQVPALVEAGYRVATMDNRGIGASDAGPGPLTMDDMVADTAAVLDRLGDGPARVVGTSLGARVVQELLLARPEMVHRAVLMAAHARLDPVQQALSAGERALYDAGIAVPAGYRAAVTALANLSPRTRADAQAVQDWLQVLEFSEPTAGTRDQLALADFPDRTEAYRAITTPTLVVGFADDRMIPAFLSREVAEAIGPARYVELEGCGHYGYLERPAAVHEVICDFLAER
jgi:pimeloyl-ACP methyl ester carboxylesterase